MSEFVPYVTTKEIVHTKIISELLNPAGCHKEGTKYLEAFFKFFLIQLNMMTIMILRLFENEEYTGCSLKVAFDPLMS